MSTKYLVDPELLPALELIPPFVLTPASVPEIRKGMWELISPPAAVPVDGVMRREIRIPGPAGAPELRVVIYEASKRTKPTSCILDIHGGGYIIGAPEQNHFRNVKLVTELGNVVVAVSYRLAPETPYPGPVEDCYAALAWIHGHAAELGIDTARIAVRGDSAGGGLAAAVTLMARDRGKYPIAFQQLIYPMLDDRTAALPAPPFVGEFVWTHSNNHYGWKALLNQEPGSEGISAYAAPARAEQLAGLPPTYIATGALDLFVDEDMTYANRLIRAGVPTELHVYPGAFHGFDMAAGARTVQAFERDAIQSLKRALEPKE